MSVTAEIQINGVSVTESDRWEVGAFCGDECRGHQQGLGAGPLGLVMYLTVYGVDDDVIDFYLYDMDNDEVFLGMCSTTVPFITGYSYGEPWEPFVLNFVAAPTFTKDIAAFTELGGYYLIASPIGEVNPDDVGWMKTNIYDLYRFDQSADTEWINYKEVNFNLLPGTGYLYANSENVTLSFTGFPYDGDGTVSLTYDPDAQFPGWNLVGNPFAHLVYIDRPYYTMNADGSEIISVTGNTVEAMEAVFVVANAEGETVTFSAEAPEGKGAALVMNVTQNRGDLIDRAIVRFGEGRSLPKFQLNSSHTKVYIPQEGEDYAIVSVSAGRDGACTVSTEVPVNFKPEHDATYTLTFSSENIDFDYLHLIDNLTGADIDLIHPNAVIAGEDPQSPAPTYTFTAKTTDYANRFKLVFATNDEDGPSTGSGAFAFISNGNIIVNGEGTLQVIDMLGHELYSHEVAHSSFYIPHSAFASGVYVLRLINGNDVKTQKIVVE